MIRCNVQIKTKVISASLACKVLIVEDDFITSTLLKVIIKKDLFCRIPTLVAANPKEFYEFYNSNLDIDLIILDFNLCSSETGEDLLKYMRQDEQRFRKIIVIANSVSEENNSILEKLGATVLCRNKKLGKEELVSWQDTNVKHVVVRLCEHCDRHCENPPVERK